MKTRFLIACLCVLSLRAESQITLGATGSLPAAGIWYQVYNGDTSVDPGPGGANQVWDFNAFQTRDSVANAIVPCGNTSWCFAFPGSAIASIDGGGAYTYFEAHNTHVAVRGHYDSIKRLETVFSDPRVERRFPFSFNSSFVDAWENSHTTDGTLYKQTGVDSVVADGWGKLITPIGTFSQTLRIRTVSTFDDSMVIGGVSTHVGHSRHEYYSWYVHGQPLLFMTGTGSFLPAGSSTPTLFGYSKYTDEIPPPVFNLSVSEQNIHSLNVFPNPSRDLLRVDFAVAGPVSMSATLSDLTGRTVAELPTARYAAGRHQLRLHVGDLSGGIYLLRLNTGSEIISRKVHVLGLAHQ